MLIKIEASLHDDNTCIKQLLVPADVSFRAFWKLPAMKKVVSHPAHKNEYAGKVE
jgi:hypothetical protein